MPHLVNLKVKLLVRQFFTNYIIGIGDTYVCALWYVIVIRWRRVVYGLYTSGCVFIGHEGVARVVY